MSLFPAALLGYLIGGIPTGILVSRAVSGIDPRTLGSGSSGATNVSRAIGRKWALVVLILDALKGYLPVLVLAPLIAPSVETPVARVVMGLAAVAGHVWTPYAGFRGGKGIATAAGVMLALDPLATLFAIGAWLLAFLLFRRVSLASMTAALAVPSSMFSLGGRSVELRVAGLLLALFLLFTHRANIQRLIAGHERPFGR